MPTERQRREADRRRRKRQQQRRMQKDVRRRRNSLLISIIGVLVVAAIVASVVVATTNDSSTPAAGPTASVATPTTPTTSASIPAEPYPCSWIPSGTASRQVNTPATDTPPRSGTVNLLVNTSQGAITFQLDRSLAPCAVESFVSLAEQQYFAQTPCHRLTSLSFYVVQCGDPDGTGLGGPGYTIPDEATGDESYPAGTIAMARQAGVPHSAGSQFFIVYKNSPNLAQSLGTQQYTVFGKVTSGLDVVQKVADKGSTPTGDGKPILPLTLNSVSVVE
jgi:peptidyl-prolyl cis-trans isomerase B (cyclophilin B)